MKQSKDQTVAWSGGLQPNPNIWEAEEAKSQIQSQPELYSKMISKRQKEMELGYKIKLKIDYLLPASEQASKNEYALKKIKLA